MLMPGNRLSLRTRLCLRVTMPLRILMSQRIAVSFGIALFLRISALPRAVPLLRLPIADAVVVAGMTVVVKAAPGEFPKVVSMPVAVVEITTAYKVIVNPAIDVVRNFGANGSLRAAVRSGVIHFGSPRIINAAGKRQAEAECE